MIALFDTYDALIVTATAVAQVYATHRLLHPFPTVLPTPKNGARLESLSCCYLRSCCRFSIICPRHGFTFAGCGQHVIHTNMHSLRYLRYLPVSRNRYHCCCIICMIYIYICMYHTYSTTRTLILCSCTPYYVIPAVNNRKQRHSNHSNDTAVGLGIN